jgi:hypothetical protein
MAMFTRETMWAFIQEALPEADLAVVEKATRGCPVAQALHQDMLARGDAGEHSVGGIWRRERLSCLTREQLGGYLLGATDVELSQYIEFHLKTIACECCVANLEDLRRQQGARDTASARRRQQIFASSAGLLPASPRR